MNKLTLLLLTLPTIALADNNLLPEPVTGIHVVPDSQLSRTDEMKKRDKMEMMQQKKHGYIQADSGYPRYLYNLKYKVKSQAEKNGETDLKSKVSDINLAFPFNGISFIQQENVIGFAPAGSYKNGWTGIKEIFTQKDMGTCGITMFDIAISHGGARIGQSVVQYDINKKPTTTIIKGSINSGFLYTVNWYDNKFIYMFECANMELDKNIISKMIDMGKKIDKEIG
jgi:hypothetical protein